MNRLRKMICRILMFIVAVPLLLSGCGSSSNSSSSFPQQVNLEKAALLVSINTSLLKPIPKSIAGWEWQRFATAFGTILSSSSYNLSMQKVSYQSTGADGKTRTLSGLLILPKTSSSKPSVPILMFQHGTEPYRQYAPSRYLDNMLRPTDYPEVMVAAAIASTGYAVAMADYEGLGDSTGPQPYVHGASLAIQVVDMLRASRAIITGGTSPCSWNNRLFLMGYSEGGYVTMAATRELQLNHSAEFTVTASAPLSGPHDLSGTMRGVMLADTTSKAPYFLPFVLNSFNYVYSGQTALFSPTSTLKSNFASTVPPLFNGNYPSDTISEAMGMSFDPAELIVPKTTLTSQFLEQLALDSSPVVNFLRENDSYRGWTPTVPIRMVHHGDDELVPFTNSQVAFNSFSTAGAKRYVTLVRETVTIPLSSNPVMTTHVSAAFPILFNGWQWLETFKK
jgi:pimeloyl-ACP methyl ester carboxylesterase